MKKLIASLLSAAILLGTAACGGAPSSSAPASSAAGGGSSSMEEPTEKVTIKFANHMVLENGTKDFWEKFKSDFETKHPNITLEYVTAPYDQILNTVINMAGGGDKVDIFLGETSWTPTVEESGLAVPVKNIVGDQMVADVLPGVAKAHMIDGDLYALPLYMTPFVLFYNKDLFKQAGLDPDTPPKTYDEMLKMAEKLSKLKTKDGNTVYAFGQTTASVAISGASLTSMVYNFGGRVLNDDGTLATDNAAFKDAFSMLKTLDEKKYNPQNAKLKDLRNLFALGQLAMYYDQSWGYSGIQSINSNAADFTATAAPLSGGSGKGESVVSSHCLFLMDNGDARKKASAILIKELINADTLGDFMSKVNLAYPAYTSMKDMQAIKDSPVLKGALGSLDCVQPTTFVPALNDLNLELCTFAQGLTVGKKTFDSAYPGFKSAAQKILQQ
ncbi:extracellular solute-binding protein [Caproiciproducens sp. NJN-50]|uniref:ABC transporter substrate-binding protein n=1 Tax=Acutalibacteraceae TaxID=3082771 RepID=UPI000FFE196D|nr:MULTISPECIES: extracellular solute-binding protein [Acutalibacteraceae]QAT50517.1 extracellular solute-binding protein [Caproiciproducens sp. NJN-50]